MAGSDEATANSIRPPLVPDQGNALAPKSKQPLLDWKLPVILGAATGVIAGIFYFVVMQSRVEATEAAWGAVIVGVGSALINGLFARGGFRRAHERGKRSEDHSN